MTPKLEKIWIDTGLMDKGMELRIDWSNDYHHAFAIRHPHGPEQVANALREAAIFVARDVVLNRHPNETRHETALRYIRQAEYPQNTVACEAIREEKEGK